MIPLYDREKLRQELRKIDFDSHKPSGNREELYEGSSEKLSTYSEDRILDVIQYLRGDSGRNGKTRMEIMSEHQKGSYEFNKRGGASTREILHETFMREKTEAERGTCSDNYYETDCTVRTAPQQRSLDDIKAEYINEMNKLTQKYQEEINNLR